MPPRIVHGVDLGPLERTARWIEETAPDKLERELPKRIEKSKGEVDALMRAAALAAARSTQWPADPARPLPHAGLVLPSLRSAARRLEELSEERARAAVRVAAEAAVRQTNLEIAAQGGPVPLPIFKDGVGAKEEILFSFLEEVRAGHADRADERFTWLAKDLDKGPLMDVVLSAGLEGVTRDAHKVISVVEGAAALSWLGWEWAPLVLRPVVRLQASGAHELDEYRRCLDEVQRLELLSSARRRPPGPPSYGEQDPQGFFQRAVAWAEGTPDERRAQVSAALREERTLEDLAEWIGVGATLLVLQDALRQMTALWSQPTADLMAHRITSVTAMTRLVRLGTPGQRVLGLLLAGYLPTLVDLRLQPRSPDCGWWLPSALRWCETAPATEPVSAAERAEWEGAVREGRPTELLPILSRVLESGRGVDDLLPPLIWIAVERRVLTGLAVKLERTLSEAHRTTRSPHRWLHVWALAVVLSLWPRTD